MGSTRSKLRPTLADCPAPLTCERRRTALTYVLSVADTSCTLGAYERKSLKSGGAIF